MVVQYVIRCPTCFSETAYIAEKVFPQFFMCNGCQRFVVLHGTCVYTVTRECVERILSIVPLKVCGKLNGCKMSKLAKNIDESQKIVDLHKLLSVDMDVNDFIKKLS